VKGFTVLGGTHSLALRVFCCRCSEQWEHVAAPRAHSRGTDSCTSRVWLSVPTTRYALHLDPLRATFRPATLLLSASRRLGALHGDAVPLPSSASLHAKLAAVPTVSLQFLPLFHDQR
jgi:hypothetical protein